MGFQALRGTTDLLPDEVKRWSAVEHTVRRLARVYGYQELRTPLIEDAALFLRSVGETTDIIQKEMFRFEDRGGHEIVLRPEGTASVVRAYLEHNLHKTQGFAKLFYLGPMFRAERPQAGRFRQFHQYGVEAIGSESPWVDVEVITLCIRILEACGVKGTTVWLSSMGCRPDQEKSARTLKLKLEPYKAELDQQCQSRLERNVFRVLDCKNPICQAIVSKILSTAEGGAATGSPFNTCDECRAHLANVKLGLKDVVSFDDTKVFARGLDYYTRTVFEVRAAGLGAQDAVAAGGRYDHLVKELGGPSMGAFGFAAGIERVLMAAGKSETAPEGAPSRRSGLYLAVAQPTLLGRGVEFVQELRERGVTALMDYDNKSLKAQLREADKRGCALVAILGETEVKQQMMTLKDLGQGSQRTVSFETFVDEVTRETKTACH